MRRIPYIFFLTIVSAFNLKAQDSLNITSLCSDFASTFCTLDLRDSIHNIKIDSLVGVDTVVYGLSTTPTGYSDVRYALNSCGVSTTTICENDMDSLYYQVYYPKKIGNTNINYNSCKFSALILFHGGSYDECGSLYNPGVIFIAKEYAKRGFIVFNVEYRRGVLIDSRTTTSGIQYTSAQQMLAIYRASQDARGAIRSIIKRQINHSSQFSGDPYQIDINNLFVGGTGAGSVVAMNAVYYQNQDMINAAYPGIINALGPIEQNFYYGDTTIEFAPLVKGVVNMWGALLVPYSGHNHPNLFFANNNYMPPIISFCGKDDQIFQFDGEPLYFSPSTITTQGIYLNTESHCLLTSSYTVPGTNDDPDLYQLGSSNIYDMFRTMTIPSEFYLDCTMMHGLDDDCVRCSPGGPKAYYKISGSCFDCVFDSDFGTGFTNSDDVNKYMVGRGATFFQGAMGTNVLNNLLITKFVECQNNRNTCNTTNNNACPYSSVVTQDAYDCTDWSQ